MRKIVPVLLLFAALCPASFGNTMIAQNYLNNQTDIVFEEEKREEINLEEAKAQLNKVLNQYMPQAQVSSIEKISINGKTVIRCVVEYGGTVITFNMDPVTGKISDMKTNQGSFVLDKPQLVKTKAGVQLTTAEVNKMLKKAIPNASVEKVKYDKKEGIISGYTVYEGLKYYFEIDSVRGNVIKMEPSGN